MLSFASVKMRSFLPRAARPSSRRIASVSLIELCLDADTECRASAAYEAFEGEHLSLHSSIDSALVSRSTSESSTFQRSSSVRSSSRS